MLSRSLQQRSRARLGSCHVDLRRVVMQAEAWMPFDVLVLEGHRSPARQERLFRQGRREAGGRWVIAEPERVVTCFDGRTRPGKHVDTPSQAVVMAPWPLDLADRDRFLVMAGVVLASAAALRLPVRWGGQWEGGWIDSATPEDRPEIPLFDLAYFQLNRSTY